MVRWRNHAAPRSLRSFARTSRVPCVRPCGNESMTEGQGEGLYWVVLSRLRVRYRDTDFGRCEGPRDCGHSPASTPDPHMDVYAKLNPPVPTPADELCSCATVAALLLQPHLSSRSDTSVRRLLVRGAARADLAPDILAESLGEWASFQDAFETLWLDSGEYEDFARAVLEDFNSPLNQRGYSLALELDAILSCRYCLFQDTGRDNYVDPTTCPRCSAELTPAEKWQECARCKIVV